MEKSLTEWQLEIHQLAIDKGWYEKERSALEAHMLIVSEVAEATEAARAGKTDFYYVGDKPEGEQVELADAVIRIMDYFGYKGWSLESAIRLKNDYNKTRPHRHGGKLF